MSQFRSWLTCAFLLATIVARGPHSHDRSTPRFTEEFGSCDESGRHWAGHEAVATDDDSADCPLCQLRDQSMLAEPTTTRATPVGHATAIAALIPGVPKQIKRQDRCRAPPAN